MERNVRDPGLLRAHFCGHLHFGFQTSNNSDFILIRFEDAVGAYQFLISVIVFTKILLTVKMTGKWPSFTPPIVTVFHGKSADSRPGKAEQISPLRIACSRRSCKLTEMLSFGMQRLRLLRSSETYSSEIE